MTMRMRAALIGGILTAGLLLPLWAQETVTLSVAEQPPSNTAYHVERLTLDFETGRILIQLLGVNGEAKSCVYTASTTPTGTFLLTALNKSNLSSAYAGNATTGSLKQRIFHRLVVMGEGASVCTGGLSGTVTGSVP